MTQKAGQKCTAIRRVLVPAAVADRVRDDLVDRLAGDRGRATRRRTACAWARSPPPHQHRGRARGHRRRSPRDGRLVFGVRRPSKPVGAPAGKGFFVAPGPDRGGAGRRRAHRPLARGVRPVATVVPYSGDAAEAAEIVARGERRPRVVGLLRGHGLHQRGGAGPRPVPRPRLPGQREDRRAVAGAGHRAAPASSTAARAAPAAARSWAACAASPSTCSAWPSKARGPSSRRSRGRRAAELFLEDLGHRDFEAGQHVVAGQAIALLQLPHVRKRSVDGNDSRLGIHEPDESHTDGQVLP